MQDTYLFARNGERAIALVNPDQHIVEALAAVLLVEGYAVRQWASLDAFMAESAQRISVLIANDDDFEQRLPSTMREFQQAYPSVPVFVIQTRPDVRRACRDIRRGVHDVFSLPLNAEEFRSAVREAMTTPILRSGNAQLRVAVPGFQSLTPREREVLSGILNTRTTAEIGRVLKISPRTVEVHRSRIMMKMRARNVADLVRMAFDGGARIPTGAFPTILEPQSPPEAAATQ